MPVSTTFAARYWNAAPRERVAVLAAVDGMTAAVLHALELVRALVELVVADGRDVQAERVHRLDRRLVVEERREQRARADEVAGADEVRLVVARLRAQLVDPGRQVLDAAASTSTVRPRRPTGARRPRRRLRCCRGSR